MSYDNCDRTLLPSLVGGGDDRGVFEGSASCMDCASADGPVVQVPLNEPVSSVSGPSLCDPEPAAHYIVNMLDLLATITSPFAVFYRASVDGDGTVRTSRARDLLPLPLPCCLEYSPVLGAMIKLSVVGLNFMHAGNVFDSSCLPPCGKGTSGQQVALEGAIDKCKRLEMRLREWGDSKSGFLTAADAFSAFTSTDGRDYPELIADYVDLPCRSGTCDPAENIDPVIAATIASPTHIFPDGPPRTAPARCPARSRAEYLRLVARQLLCGKLRLRLDAQSAAPIFVVGKKAGTRQREVWSGDVISAVATRPPRPRRLGNPSVFTKIVKAKDTRLHFSKRDAKTYFDLLLLPTSMRPYFGRPRVNLGKLAETLHMPVEDLRSYFDGCGSRNLRSGMYVTPVSVTWPMGFSWSSFVAQEQMVTVCRTAGLEEHQLLCLDDPCPIGCGELATVATDDVVFVHSCPDVATSRLETYDSALASYNIEKNPDKDVDCVAEVTALGVHVSNSPPLVEADIGKLSSLLPGFVGLLKSSHVSPLHFAGMLGVAQWFCQVSRWIYSAFHKVYEFQRLEPQDKTMVMGTHVQSEVYLFVALAPFLQADMERNFIPLITTCDASPSYGFGVSVHACSESLIHDLAECAESHNQYLRTDDPTGGEKPRQGTPVRLPFSMDSFTDVLSIKARHISHSGAMEAHALLLLIKWILRARTRFNTRVLVGIDALAILYAVSKGRTSAPTLQKIARSIAAGRWSDAVSHLRAVRVEPLGRPKQGQETQPDNSTNG